MRFPIRIRLRQIEQIFISTKSFQNYHSLSSSIAFDSKNFRTIHKFKMASKSVGVFVLLVFCQVCLSTHRFLRDSPAKVDAPSESSEESLDQMAETIQKYLSPKDADDVKKIISDINSAKDSEQNVDRDYIKLIELGIKAIANQYETDNTTTIATL